MHSLPMHCTTLNMERQALTICFSDAEPGPGLVSSYVWYSLPSLCCVSVFVLLTMQAHNHRLMSSLLLLIASALERNHAGIEAALANLTGAGGNGGGILYFPAGRFVVSRPLVLSGLYGVEVAGAGAVPSFCPGAGSALLSMSTNVTVLVFDRCTMCTVARIAVGHVSQPCCSHSSAPEAHPMVPAPHDGRGPTHRTAARRLAPHRFGVLESRSGACQGEEHKNVTLNGGELPTSGVAIDVVGSFQ